MHERALGQADEVRHRRLAGILVGEVGDAEKGRQLVVLGAGAGRDAVADQLLAVGGDGLFGRGGQAADDGCARKGAGGRGGEGARGGGGLAGGVAEEEGHCGGLVGWLV